MLYNQIGEVSALPPGTGNVELNGAITAHKSFDDPYSGITHPATNVRVKYKIVGATDATKYERGRGSYSKSGLTKTLVRSKVYESSVANGLVDFTGLVHVYISADQNSFGPGVGVEMYTRTDPAGSSTVYTAVMTPALPEYVDGQLFHIEFDKACGNNPTLDLGPGAKALGVGSAGSNLLANYLGANSRCLVSYRAATDKFIVEAGVSPFLPLAGGSLTGDLFINKDTPALVLNTTGANDPGIHLRVANTTRSIAGYSTAGQYFYINSYNSSGVYIGTPFTASAINNKVGVPGADFNVGSTTLYNPTSMLSTLQLSGAGDFLSSLLVRGQLTTWNSALIISNPSLARVQMNTSSRLWTAGMWNTTEYAIADETGAQARMIMAPGGATRFVNGNGHLNGPGTMNYADWDANFKAYLNNGVYVVPAWVNANCYFAYDRNTGNWDWVVNSTTLGQLNWANGLGFRSVSTAKAWLHGDTSGAVHGAMNISSLSVFGAGNVRLNFTNPINGAYTVIASSAHTTFIRVAGLVDGGAQSNFGVDMQVRNQVATLVDGRLQVVILAPGV